MFQAGKQEAIPQAEGAVQRKRTMSVNNVDGISRGLKLLSYIYNTEKAQAEFEFFQASTGSYYTERFRDPSGGSDKQKKFVVDSFKHFIDVFKADEWNENRENLKWGDTVVDFASWQEFVEFYVNKLEIPSTTLVDMKLMYDKPVVFQVEEGKTPYPPYTSHGYYPWISSELVKRALSAEGDVNNEDETRRRYLAYAIESIVSVSASEATSTTEEEIDAF